MTAIPSSPTPSQIVDAVNDSERKITSLTASDIGAATPTQVDAAIQAAIQDSWEASY